MNFHQLQSRSVWAIVGLLLMVGTAWAGPCDTPTPNPQTNVAPGVYFPEFCFKTTDSNGQPLSITSYGVVLDGGARQVITVTAQPVTNTNGQTSFRSNQSVTLSAGPHTLVLDVVTTTGTRSVTLNTLPPPLGAPGPLTNFTVTQ